MYTKESPPLIDEKELLKKISKRDEGAFKIIYDIYKKKVYSVALKILKSDDLAEDALHEVFLKVWKYSDNIDQINNIDSYLRIATTNQALKILRKQKNQLKFNLACSNNWTEIQHETEEAIFFKDTEKILLEAVEKLPPQQKSVFLLCKEEGLKYAEVAERLSLSRLTVKTHMQHALRFLRSYLHSHTDITILILLFQLWHKK